jgi:hypothetical protein
MAFHADDLSTTFTPYTPAAKGVQARRVQATRADTTARLVAQLPGDASIVGIKISGTASNAGTTATLSVGTTSTATELINAQSVLAAGLPTGMIGVMDLPATTAPKNIYVKYAESGTASSAGGAWDVVIFFVR